MDISFLTLEDFLPAEWFTSSTRLKNINVCDDNNPRMRGFFVRKIWMAFPIPLSRALIHSTISFTYILAHMSFSLKFYV